MAKKNQYRLKYGRQTPFRRTVQVGKKAPYLMTFEPDQDYELTPGEQEALAKEIGIGLLVHTNLDARGRQRDPRLNSPDVEQEFAELEKRIEELSQENAELEKRIEELSQENAELEKRIEELSQENAELEKRIEELSQENAELRELIELADGSEVAVESEDDPTADTD